MEILASGRVVPETVPVEASMTMPVLPVCELLPPATGDEEHMQKNRLAPAIKTFAMTESFFI